MSGVGNNALRNYYESVAPALGLAKNPFAQGLTYPYATQTDISQGDANFMSSVFADIVPHSGATTGGGGGGILGGYDQLISYANTVYSKGKEKLIRDIAADVFKAMQVKGGPAFAKDKPIDKVVAELARLAPNPSKPLPKNLSSQNQKKVCDVLAAAINKYYKMNLIDRSLSPSAVCQHVAEVMFTLFQGLSSEFLLVSADLSRILRNLRMLRELTQQSYNRQKQLVLQTGDSSSKMQSDSVDQFHKRIDQEFDRQMVLISNTLSQATGPLGSSLIKHVEDNKDFANLVKDLKADFGTPAFADKLTHLLHGMASVAHTASLVEKALKKIGMSVSEYKNTSGIRDLRQKIYEHMAKKNPSSKELQEMAESAAILYRNDYAHENIADHLSSKGGNKNSKHGGIEIKLHDDPDDPDNSEPAYWAKKNLSKKLKKQDKVRTLLMKDFNKRVQSLMHDIVQSARGISPEIGKGIPISDDLNRFILMFKNLKHVDEEGLYSALSGYNKDSESKQHKHQFLESFRILSDAAGVLATGTAGHHFKLLQKTIGELVKTVDDFSSKFMSALTEVSMDNPSDIKKELRSFYGSGEYNNQREIVTLGRIKNEMHHAWQIATMRGDLARSAAEFKNLGEDYENMLGDEAGWLINKVTERFNFQKATLEGNPDFKINNKGLSDTARVLANGIKTKINSDDKKLAKRMKDLTDTIVELLRVQKNAKKGMIEAAQAVDLYLKAFADGIAMHPDEVKDLAGSLTNIDQVFRWFNNSSGNHLCALFDSFPRGPGLLPEKRNYGVSVSDDNSVSYEPVSRKSHYYTEIDENDPKLGNPFSGIALKSKAHLKAYFESASRTLNTMRALENVLNIFAKLGKKYGGVDLNSKTFMNPGQLSNAINDYVIASAFTSGFMANIDKLLNVNIATLGGVLKTTASNVKDKGVFGNAARAHLQAKLPAKVPVPAATRPPPTAPAASAPAASVPAVSLPSKLGLLVGTNSLHNEDNLLAFAMSAVPIMGSDDGSTTFADTHVHEGFDWAGYNNNFAETDHLFIMTIKGIVCKILTVVETWNMLNKPVDNLSLGSLSTVRTIIGGGQSRPKVIPDAIELYVRLPLLAEWFREKFDFKKQTGDNLTSRQVSMVPSVNGIWSEFIKLIFRSADYVENGTYTESQANILIKEINKIYQAYKAKYQKNTVRAVMTALCAEMNRRYGFVKKEEINKYLEHSHRQYKTKYDKTDKSEDRVNFDLLDAENQFGRQPAPSDKFIKVGTAFTAKERKQKRLHELHKAMLDFRKRIDLDFAEFASEPKNNQISFVNTISQYKTDLKVAKDDESKYQIALKAIQGINRFSNLAQEKIVIVHEFVTFPLNLLLSNYKKLLKYNIVVHSCDPDTITGSDEDWRKHVRKRMMDKSSYLKNQLLRDGIHQDDVLNVINGENYDTILYKYFNYLLSVLINLVSNPDKLIVMNVTTEGKILVDYSKMEEKMLSMLRSVRRNIDLFRANFIKHEGFAVTQFEDHKKEGSVYWLGEEMKDVLFGNRDKMGLPESNEALNKIWKKCQTTLDGRKINDTFSHMIYYPADNKHTVEIESAAFNSKKFPFVVAGLRNDLESKLVKSETDIIKTSGVTIPSAFFNIPSREILYDTNETWIVYGHSLYYIFNTILANYVNQGFDLVSSKFYVPLIEEFANGPAAHAVMKDGGYPDMHEPRDSKTAENINNSKDIINRFFNRSAVTNASLGFKPYNPTLEDLRRDPMISGIEAMGSSGSTKLTNDDIRKIYEGKYETFRVTERGRPKPFQVINASLGMTIRQILVRMDKTNKKKLFPMESISEMPMHMKEKLKANLPAYAKILDCLCCKAESILLLIKNGNLKLKPIPRSVAAGLKNSRLKRDQQPTDDVSAGANDTRVWYETYINHMIELIRSLNRCVRKVQRELNDAPIYGQLYYNSMSDYKSRYNTNPVIPLSSAMRSVKYINEQIPKNDNGSAAFKLRYCVRGLLRSDIVPNFDNIPGVKDLVLSYNAISSKSTMFDLSTAKEQMTTIVDLLQHESNSLIINHLLSPYINELRFQWANRISYDYSQTNVNTNVIVAMAESGNPSTNKEKIVEVICGNNFKSSSVKNKSRRELRAFNILDMNIVPINIHAFIREVPWAQLLNYSYSYDRMVHELLLPGWTKHMTLKYNNTDDKIKNLLIGLHHKPNSTQMLMAKTLIHPFAKYTATDYHGLYSRIALGESVLGGRPKWISDELWCKALLNAPYGYGKDHGYPDEAGPAVWSSQRRARSNRMAGMSNTINVLTDLNIKIGVTSVLTWMDGSELKEKKINRAVNANLQTLGHARHYTRFVRCLEWFANNQRLIRILLSERLKGSKNPVGSARKMLSSNFTDYSGNKMYDSSEYDHLSSTQIFDPPSQYSDAIYGSASPYSPIKSTEDLINLSRPSRFPDPQNYSNATITQERKSNHYDFIDKLDLILSKQVKPSVPSGMFSRIPLFKNIFGTVLPSAPSAPAPSAPAPSAPAPSAPASSEVKLPSNNLRGAPTDPHVNVSNNEAKMKERKEQGDGAGDGSTTPKDRHTFFPLRHDTSGDLYPPIGSPSSDLSGDPPISVKQTNK